MLFPPPNRPGPSRRVVVTGAGIVTSLGIGWAENADGFREGRVAIKPVTVFDASRQRVKVAGEVELPGAMPKTRLGLRCLQRLDRASRMLLLAAHQAWEEAGWGPRKMCR